MSTPTPEVEAVAPASTDTASPAYLLLPALLQAIAAGFGRTPGWPAIAAQVLMHLASWLEQSQISVSAYRELTEQLKTWVRDGRDPTQEDFAALLGRSNTAHAMLQAPATDPTPDTIGSDIPP